MSENSKFLYGKNAIDGITSIQVEDGVAFLYSDNGQSQMEQQKYFILYSNMEYDDMIQLNGDLEYKYARTFTESRDYYHALGEARRRQLDHFVVYDPVEQFMIKNGVTYYNGMDVKDVSVLSFDIETTGLNPKTNEVILISSTLRKGDNITRKLFSYDQYDSEEEMIDAWCEFVRASNPSILIGHNIFGFDLPFLRERAGDLQLGRDNSNAKFARRPSKFRKDGSQSYDYFNVRIAGREIIDTFHLSIKYDIARNYPSYGLKAIIEHEGLEREGRQHYDASTIKDNFRDKQEFEKIKQYAVHDADDSLALYDLMIPAFFHYAKYIPKSFQQIINSASGSQVNSFLLRSYISEGHSIPKTTDTFHYQGGISYGNPGIYKYVGKVDVASLYPSIILQHRVHDFKKDPKKYFLKMVELFTEERLKNKELAKQSGERLYKDLEQAQKIIINSAYGFMGAPGLNFNSPLSAASITKHAREILQKGIKWAEDKRFQIVNVDTDSFSFTPGNKFPSGAFSAWIEELNELFPEKIVWEDDGIYTKFIVVKAKNYITQAYKTQDVKIKGSGLKATMKEPALKQFIKDVINLLLEEKYGDLRTTYDDYARMAISVDSDSIGQWASKKTVTKAVLNPQRTNEQRIKDAIESSGETFSEGDKIKVFFSEKTKLSLVSDFTGEYDVNTLLSKLFKTAKIFESIISMEEFPNYSLKRNKKLLEGLNEERSAQQMGLFTVEPIREQTAGLRIPENTGRDRP